MGRTWRAGRGSTYWRPTSNPKRWQLGTRTVDKESRDGLNGISVLAGGYSADANGGSAAVSHLLELGYVDPDEIAAKEVANRCQQETELNRAISLLDSGLAPQAVSELKLVAEHNPDWLQPHELLAKAYYQANQRELAKQEIDWLSWHGDESPQLYFLRATIALDERQFDSALVHLRCARSARQPLPGLLALEGCIHLRRRDFAAAKIAFQSSIDVDGPTPRALDGMATICLHSGRHEDAALHAPGCSGTRHAIRPGTLSPRPRVTALNRLPEAYRAFESWAAAEPQRAASYRWLAHLAQHHLNDSSLAATYRNQAREAVRSRRASSRSRQSDGTSTSSSAP